MNNNRKNIWSEGMFLTPHHFQQWDRYFDAAMIDRIHSLLPFGWGVTNIKVDQDGLVNGCFTLLNFEGIMPDGLVIKIPETDMPPEMRQVTEFFLPTMNHLDVFLGLPVYNPSVANCRIDERKLSRATRFSVEYVKVPDENTGENLREVAIARKNLKIFFSGEETVDYVTLKIAELMRSPAGTIVINENYIPPSLTMASSVYLTRLVRGILELLTAKSNSMSGIRRGTSEPGSSISKLLLLNVLNGYIPLLSHIIHVERHHPEALYMILSQMTGELSTFTSSFNPNEIPPYYHTDISGTFRELDRKIRSILEGATPTQCITIPLEVSRENILVGRVSDEKLLTSSQFFLAASGDFPEEQLRDFIPRRLKVGSLNELDMIVSTAMPGVKLYYVPRPPSSIPIKTGCHYFRIESSGDFWNSICRSKAIAFYVPADLKKMQFELIATKE